MCTEARLGFNSAWDISLELTNVLRGWYKWGLGASQLELTFDPRDTGVSNTIDGKPFQETENRQPDHQKWQVVENLNASETIQYTYLVKYV